MPQRGAHTSVTMNSGVRRVYHAVLFTRLSSSNAVITLYPLSYPMPNKHASRPRSSSVELGASITTSRFKNSRFKYRSACINTSGARTYINNTNPFAHQVIKPTKRTEGSLSRQVIYPADRCKMPSCDASNLIGFRLGTPHRGSCLLTAAYRQSTYLPSFVALFSSDVKPSCSKLRPAIRSPLPKNLGRLIPLAYKSP